MAEQLLQTIPPTTIVQHSSSSTTKLSTPNFPSLRDFSSQSIISLDHDLQKLLKEEAKQDGILNATQQQFSQAAKPNLYQFNPTDIQGKFSTSSISIVDVSLRF